MLMSRLPTEDRRSNIILLTNATLFQEFISSLPTNIENSNLTLYFSRLRLQCLIDRLLGHRRSALLSLHP
jgi:hypothetical protein